MMRFSGQKMIAEIVIAGMTQMRTGFFIVRNRSIILYRCRLYEEKGVRF